MAENRPPEELHATDDELLAGAIPIPHDEEGDQEQDASEQASGDEREDLRPIDLGPDAPTPPAGGKSKKIRTFDTRVPHEDKWQRTPNLTGSGAIHVKTFVAKLRLDAIDHLDGQINEWLDNHPEYEVKFVTTTVGKLVGKLTEDALFVNVWV